VGLLFSGQKAKSPAFATLGFLGQSDELNRQGQETAWNLRVISLP
jgi:hypothetical protein